MCCRGLQDLANPYIQFITLSHKSEQGKMKSVATEDNQPNEDISLS
jgi:hypothetical protein